jgi:chitodextrinase
MRIRPQIIVAIASLAWGCVSSTKTGKAPVQDVAAAVDVAVDAGVPDSAHDLGPQPDTAPPVDASQEPVDTFVPPVQDTTPPTWPEGASLQASELEPTSLTLSWPMASDDTFVATYRVYRDGLLEKTLPSAKSKIKITEMDEAETVSLSVVALDEAGNSSQALTLTVQTGDETPPTWPGEMSLIASYTWATGIFLSWTPASDNVQVSEYRIMDGETIARTIVGATQGDVSTLKPWSEYTLYVVAVDGVGNISKPGPSLTFKTPDTQAPTWADGSALGIDVLDETSLTISWKHDATDAGGLASYTVFQDKVALKTLGLAQMGDDTQLIVKGLKAAGSYDFAVQATDKAGNMSSNGPTATMNMQDQTAPTWPEGTDLLASNITPNTLTIAWTPATDDVSVTAYHVHQGGQEVAVVATTHAKIQGLGPWTDYTFTVWAKDGAGNLSKEGPNLTLKTLDSSHPVWPEGAALSASAVTPHGLGWPHATDDVSVVHQHVFQDGVKIAAIDGKATSFVVSGLSPWTHYDFSVRAEDQAGNMSQADLTLTVKSTDEVAPSWNAGELVASEIKPHALTLTWPSATDDVATTTYSVTMDGEELVSLAGDVTSLEVVDLAPWTDYTLAVTALDAAGNSSLSLQVTAQTMDNVAPSWPLGTSLTATDISGTSMTLTWPAADDDVEVAGYHVFVDGSEVSVTASDVTLANLSSLKSGHYYLMEVQAVDLAGNESTHLKLSVSTLNLPPTWPADAKLTASAGAQDVYLSWPPAQDNVGVTAYRVFQDGVSIGDGPELVRVVEGLEGDATYAFGVEAKDADGNWSQDGPGVTVTTSKIHDPGFRRLSQEQLNRALADVASTLWMEGCHNRFGEDCDCTGLPGTCAHGWGAYSDADAVYETITGIHYGEWKQYVDTQHEDSRVAAPADVYGGHWRLDQFVFDEHVTSWTLGAMTLANSWFEKKDYKGHERGARLILDPCKMANDQGVTNFGTLKEVYDNCASDFIGRLGRRAYRQPLTAEEHAFFISVYNEVSEKYADENLDDWYTATRGLRNVIATLLSSPKFLYQVELGDDNGNLTAWELASRLSFHFWNSGPDDLLLQAAEDESLLTEEGYQAQVDRLFSDSRANRAIEEFYRAFFRVDDIDDIDMQDGPAASKKYYYHSGPNYEAGAHPKMVGDGKNTFLGQYLKSARAELLNLGTWFTRSHPGTYEDMFRSNLHFLECQEKWVEGQCYGAGALSLFSYGILGTCTDMTDCGDKLFIDTGNGWDGVSPPITLPEPERAGLITRISILGADTYTARPIQRGLKIRDMLLCDPIPPPENCDVVKPPNLTGLCSLDGVSTGQSCSHNMQCADNEVCSNWDKEVTMTVRDKVEELTETPGTTCVGCHSTFINGFGLGLNHFSSMGQYWDKEHMFTTERHNFTGNFQYNTHTPDQWAPIDATGTTIFNGEMVSFEGAHEVADILADSGKLESCWSREYFRFAMGRVERDSDADSIEDLAQMLRDGVTLADGFKNFVFLPQFKNLYTPAKAQPPGDAP